MAGDDPEVDLVRPVREALSRRRANYVVVGPLERKEYGTGLFRAHGDARRVFSGQGTEVWEVAR